MSISKGIALITGSAQGIGRDIALRLARDGFDIALNDFPSKRAQLGAIVDDIEKIGRKTHLAPADVTKEGEVKGMIQSVVEKLGGLDMVANAGVVSFAPLVSTELDEWERVMAINARGPLLCYKHAAAQMIEQGRGGRIIGASSAAGKIGQPSLSSYCASKFAVRGLTQVAAQELGRYKITVNSYAPGAIDTPMAASTRETIKVSTAAVKELIELMKANMDKAPIRHVGQPEDIASIVSYLASEEAHFITGKLALTEEFLCPEGMGVSKGAYLDAQE